LKPFTGIIHLTLSGFEHCSNPNSQLRLTADAKADAKADSKENVAKEEKDTEKTRRPKMKPKGKARK